MGEEDNVSQVQLDKRTSEIYKQMHSIDKAVSRILGGIAVVSVVFTVGTAGVLYHWNYRFAETDEDIKEVKQGVSEIKEVLTEWIPVG